MSGPFEEQVDELVCQAADCHGRPDDSSEQAGVWRGFLSAAPKWLRGLIKGAKAVLGAPSDAEQAANARKTLDEAKSKAKEAEGKGVDTAIKANKEIERIAKQQGVPLNAKLTQMKVLVDQVPSLKLLSDELEEAITDLGFDGGKLLSIESAREGEAALPILSLDDQWKIYRDSGQRWRWRRSDAKGQIIDYSRGAGWKEREACEGNARLFGWDG